MAIAIGADGRHEAVPALSEPAVRPAARVEGVKPDVDGVSQAPAPLLVTNDPFAPRGWQAVAAPVEAPPVAAPPPIVAAPAPPPEPPAPGLPYAFMGQFDDGGRQLVYLSRNDQTFVVTQGDTVEGIYKVLAMGPAQIEFEHLSTGTKLALSIPAQNN